MVTVVSMIVSEVSKVALDADNSLGSGFSNRNSTATRQNTTTTRGGGGRARVPY